VANEKEVAPAKATAAKLQEAATGGQPVAIPAATERATRPHADAERTRANSERAADAPKPNRDKR